MITPQNSITSVIAAGKPLQSSYGMQNLSAFLDDVNAASAPYLYIVYSTSKDLAIARAKLGGSQH